MTFDWATHLIDRPGFPVLRDDGPDEVIRALGRPLDEGLDEQARTFFYAGVAGRWFFWFRGIRLEHLELHPKAAASGASLGLWFDALVDLPTDPRVLAASARFDEVEPGLLRSTGAGARCEVIADGDRVRKVLFFWDRP